jgi:lipid-binding SYLF domain-containing protein
MIIMKPESLASFTEGEVELGTNLTLAAGEGIKGKLLSTDQLADVYYFARVGGGVFAGMNLKGGGNQPRDDLNKIYYGRDASARALVVDRSISSDGAARLTAALAR